jgi:hypothetical protein
MKYALQDGVFWLVCLGALLLNAAIFRSRASNYAADDPRMRKEADAIVRTFVAYIGGLFVLTMAGATLGLSGGLLTPISGRRGALSSFDIVYLVLYASVFLRATWCVFGEGGAELLAKHHQMFRFAPSNKVGVMLLWVVLLLALGYGIVRAIADAA